MNKVFKILFGFLIPYILINGIILFLFIQTPAINVVNENDAEYDEKKIKFTISSIIPITNISAYYGETEVPYTKLGFIYSVDAENNGTYQIKVTTLTKASANSYVEIETHDTEPPIINTDEATMSGDTLTITIMDSQSEINYDEVYGINTNNERVKPSYIDKASGTLQFKIEKKKKFIIHVEDINGNYSEATINAG